jgi:hypothetical protein
MRFRLEMTNDQDSDREAVKRLLRRLLDILDSEHVMSGTITDCKGKPIGKFEIQG